MRSNQLTVALVFGLVAFAPLGCLGEDEPPARARPGSADAPVEWVYLGVSCREPNSVRCDRVGLYVWLRRPAQQVAALIAGRELTLGARAAPSIRPGTQWEAFLTNAGLDDGPLAVQANSRGRWFGEPAVQTSIWLSLRFAEQPSLMRLLRTPLRPGYG